VSEAPETLDDGEFYNHVAAAVIPQDADAGTAAVLESMIDTALDITHEGGTWEASIDAVLGTIDGTLRAACRERGLPTEADLTEERRRTWEAWQTASGLEHVSQVLGAALLMLPVEMFKLVNAGEHAASGPIFRAVMAFMALSEGTRTGAHLNPEWIEQVNARLGELDRLCKAQLKAMQAEQGDTP
jgi:hypothetical protein